MAYLDRKYPEPPIFGRTPEETGYIWRLISECDSYLIGPISKVATPLFFGGAAEKKAEILEAAKTVHGELARLETSAASASWLAGSELTAADVAIFPLVQIILRAASKEDAKPLGLEFLPLGARYPSLTSWVKRIEAIPGYERTYPPHWR